MSGTILDAAMRLPVISDGIPIPAVYWAPSVPRGIVIACHGGSGHKLSPAILAIAGACLPLGLAVLAIDGPVQGDRRADGNLDPQLAVRSFREAWQAGVGHTSMAREMGAALDALQALPGFEGLPIGYIGVSMGTGYGIPLLATDKRIAAAAIGLWGLNFVASEHLAGYAREISCPVWFTQQWDDKTFDREGTFALFDAIGSPDKRLVAYPGPHRELEGERLADAMAFLAARLSTAPFIPT
jgi:alpha-beta hydrolase superfamily lysophospholipase